MRKRMTALLGLALFGVTVSSLVWAKPLSADNLPQALKHRNSGAIFGRFTIIHTRWNYQNPELEAESVDINSKCHSFMTGQLVNVETNKTYSFDFKPVLGSDTVSYYKDRVLEENTKDPYGFLAVPAGTYDLTTVTFKLVMWKGQLRFDGNIAVFPFARDIKRNIFVTVEPGQLVYIGDYQIDCKTNFMLHKVKHIYPYCQIKVAFNNNFETAKADLPDQIRVEKGLQIISGLDK